MVSTPVEVEVFGRDNLKFLFSPDRKAPVLTGELLVKEVVKQLGIKEPSVQLFALHHGPLLHPKKVLRPNDVVTADDTLCYRKHHYDLKVELKVLTKDDCALHLLYQEARTRVRHGDIELAQAEAAELSALEDPNFPTERQYVDYLIRNCPERYRNVKFRACRLQGREAGDIRPGTTVTVEFSEHLLCMVGSEGHRFESPWSRVKSWSAGADSTVSFQFYGDNDDCLLDQQLVQVWSDQPTYMTDCAMKLCVWLSETKSDPSLPTAASVDSKTRIGRPTNPYFEEFQKTLFPPPNFGKF